MNTTDPVRERIDRLHATADGIRMERLVRSAAVAPAPGPAAPAPSVAPATAPEVVGVEAPAAGACCEPCGSGARAA